MHYVGIDIAKTNHVVSTLDDDGHPQPPLMADNDLDPRPRLENLNAEGPTPRKSQP